MSVDLSKIKPGDEVLVRLTYVGHSNVAPGTGWQRLANSAREHLSVHSSDFVSHTPKALSVGDRVQLMSGGRGFIRAIIGARAWVDLVDDPDEHLNGCAYGLANLERVS